MDTQMALQSVSPVKTTGPLAAADVLDVPATPPFASQKVQEPFKELAVPFDPSVIEWRVTNATKDKTRGQVIPYADQRAYTDRLNALVTPAGWTRKYAIHTSANFQRGKDQTIVAKILVTCELTIFGLGSHSATGEEWAERRQCGYERRSAGFQAGLLLLWPGSVPVPLLRSVGRPRRAKGT